MKHASFVLLFGATVACAGIPQGASVWTFEYCYDSAFSKRVGGCNPHSATLEVLRDGNKVCGVLNEDISNKSPGAWFAGTVHHQRAVVRFVDSFQEDVTEQGKATLVSSSNAIRWNVLISTAGMRTSSPLNLRRYTDLKGRYQLQPKTCSDIAPEIPQYLDVR